MTSKTLKVCVVDDEKLIRKSLIETLSDSGNFTVVGEAESVGEGIQLLQSCDTDAVFLDIKLREGDAFQILNHLKKTNQKIPPIVLITGYNDFEYAQRTFNEYRDCVVRILQKPFWEDWDNKEKEIIQSIRESIDNREPKAFFAQDKMSIKNDYKTYLLHYDEIQYIEVAEELKGTGKMKIVTDTDSYYISYSLRLILSALPNNFIQISRFALVNGERISYFDHSDHVLFLKGLDRNFGVGQSYQEQLQKWMIS